MEVKMRYFTRVYKILSITGLLLLGSNWSPIFGQVTFSDVTQQTGLDIDIFGRGIAWGDYDNDGDNDLLVTKQLPNFPPQVSHRFFGKMMGMVISQM